MVCLGRQYPFKFFKGCLPQILLSPFLNTLSHMVILVGNLIANYYLGATKLTFIHFEILQLRAKFQAAVMPWLRFIWITHIGDHRKV